MKKLFLLLVAILSLSTLTKASTYKLDNAATELKFSTAQEISWEAALSQAVLAAKYEAKGENAKDKTIAGIAGILCGSFGIHRFYLGQNKAGLVYLGYTLCSGVVISIITAVTFGIGGILYPLVSAAWIVGVVDGIMYLVASDSEFDAKYAHNNQIIQWLHSKK